LISMGRLADRMGSCEISDAWLGDRNPWPGFKATKSKVKFKSRPMGNNEELIESADDQR
jgi:hypothetical protein